MALDLLFYSGIALLLTHELDAIQRHEWRLLPLLGRLDDDTAYYVFCILHVPLFTLLLWFLGHPSDVVRFWFQLGMDVFFVAHLGLHRLLRENRQYEFSNRFSRSVIVLLALVGLVHWVLLLRWSELPP